MIVGGVFTAEFPDLPSMEEKEDNDGGSDGDATNQSVRLQTAATGGRETATYATPSAMGRVLEVVSLTDFSQTPELSPGPQDLEDSSADDAGLLLKRLDSTGGRCTGEEDASWGRSVDDMASGRTVWASRGWW